MSSDYKEKLQNLIPSEAWDLDCLLPREGTTQKPVSIAELRRWSAPFRPLPFQRELINGVQKLVQEKPLVALLSLPTGSGKTLTTSHILLEVLNRKGRKHSDALWIAPQRELLYQASEAIQSAWWAGLGPDLLDVVVVEKSKDFGFRQRPTCWMTTPVMAKKLMGVLSDKVEVVIFDEAHHVSANTFKEIWSAYTRKVISPPRLSLGLSATPYRENHPEISSLQEAFKKNLILPKSLGSDPVRKLIELEVLALPKFRLIEGVPAFSRSKLSSDPRRLRTLVSDHQRWDAVINTLLARRDDQVVVYALDKEHGRTLTKHLRFLGIKAEYVDSDTPLFNRVGVFERFKNKDTNILVNVALLIEGVDCPASESVLLTYPVGSRLRLRQMIGRVLRGPAVGGTSNCMVWSMEGNQNWLESVVYSKDFRFAGWKSTFL